MSRHTEGPWEVIPAERGFIVTAKDGQYDIAVVRNIGNEDNEANARLMKEGPALLALLIESQHSIGGDWRERRDAAISRATGEGQ